MVDIRGKIEAANRMRKAASYSFWWADVSGERCVVYEQQDGGYVDIGTGEIYRKDQVKLDHPATDDEAASWVIESYVEGKMNDMDVENVLIFSGDDT